MASQVQNLIDQTVNIITTDGKNFVGVLKSFDQTMNIILSDCVERVYSMDEPVSILELGVFLIRGEAIAIIGEIDLDLEANVDYKTIKAKPLKSMNL